MLNEIVTKLSCLGHWVAMTANPSSNLGSDKLLRESGFLGLSPGLSYFLSFISLTILML